MYAERRDESDDSKAQRMKVACVEYSSLVTTVLKEDPAQKGTAGY